MDYDIMTNTDPGSPMKMDNRRSTIMEENQGKEADESKHNSGEIITPVLSNEEIPEVSKTSSSAPEEKRGSSRKRKAVKKTL